MSDLFKNILRDNETLFKDPLVLDYEYVPEEVKGREDEKNAKRKEGLCRMASSINLAHSRHIADWAIR